MDSRCPLSFEEGGGDAESVLNWAAVQKNLFFSRRVSGQSTNADARLSKNILLQRSVSAPRSYRAPLKQQRQRQVLRDRPDQRRERTADLLLLHLSATIRA